MFPASAATSADWLLPIPIHYGPGRLAALPEICRRSGIHKPLVVTDRGSTGLPFVRRCREMLDEAGGTMVLFPDVSPNPKDEEVYRGKKVFEEQGCDGVIALGGGSGMDAGKAISLVANRSEDLWSFDFDAPPRALEGRFVPLICVPTTAGTGAETDSTAMINRAGRGIKGCVWHPRQKPVCAILDPELTCGLPRHLTIWTGLDALTHAVEAYCVDTWDPVCDALALDALRRITAALPRALAQPEDVGARGELLTASMMAGASFLKGLGLVHSISHAVGAAFDTHHGLTNAIVLPWVLAFNGSAIEGKAAPLGEALQLPGISVAALVGGLCARLDELGIPPSLAEVGVQADRIGMMTAAAMADSATPTNPRRPSEEELSDLIRDAVTLPRKALAARGKVATGY
jgi:alcohol dehydrogenase class IV